MNPFRQGQRTSLEISGIAAGGEGIGHTAGRAVFVPRTIPGERVQVRITHVGTRKIFAEPLEIVEPSSDRVEPACPAYGRCGGCQLMHVDYPAQLALKRRILGDNLSSIAGMQIDQDLEIHPSSGATAYRNRGQYPVTRHNQKVATGFFAPRTHKVVPVERCLIHDHRLDQAVGFVRAWATRKKIPVYNEQSGRGFLRHVVVRGAREPGEILVALVGARDRGAGFGDLVRRLRRNLPDVAGVLLNLNPRRTNVILGKRTRLLWGRSWIEERLSGMRFRLSIGTFFQVNTPQAEVLFEKVCDFLKDSTGEIVDAYCGVGVLGMILANRGHRVSGIEMDQGALADARDAAIRNRVDSMSFHPGRVENVLPRLLEQGRKPSAIVLDPPRKGCADVVLEAVARSPASRVAYVSCHPGTLARDLKKLLAAGFRLERLEVVDMFPQTCHLEVFAGLVRC